MNRSIYNIKYIQLFCERFVRATINWRECCSRARTSWTCLWRPTRARRFSQHRSKFWIVVPELYKLDFLFSTIMSQLFINSFLCKKTYFFNAAILYNWCPSSHLTPSPPSFHFCPSFFIHLVRISKLLNQYCWHLGVLWGGEEDHWWAAEGPRGPERTGPE